jgi:hypothetical protein
MRDDRLMVSVTFDEQRATSPARPSSAPQWWTSFRGISRVRHPLHEPEAHDTARAGFGCLALAAGAFFE